MEAEFVSATADSVTLRKDRDQKLVTLKREQLSAADWNHIRKLQGLPPAEKPRPEYAALITGIWEHGNFESRLPYRIYGGRTIRPDKKYPLVVYLHGVHLRGDDNRKHLTGEAKSFAAERNYTKRPCFVIAPQCPKGKSWSKATNQDVVALVKEASEHLPVDPKRIYLTGYSMGGFGTWDILAKEPGLFAAAVPIAGGGDPAKAGVFKHVPIWAFHGEKDFIVPVRTTRKMVEALKEVGGKINYTEYEGAGHLVTRRIFKDESVHRWMFQQKRPK